MARGTWGGLTDPNIFRVNILFLMGVSKCQTSFKLRDVGIQDNSAQDVADEAATQLEAGFRNLLTERDTLLGFDVLKLGSEEGGWHPVTGGVGTHATAIADQVPNFIAANISLKSEIRKRYGQGRMFLPVVHQDFIDANLLNNGGQAAMQGFIDVMTEHFTGDPVTHDLILVNAHPLLPVRGAPGQPGYRAEIPASWYDVVSLRINTIATSLRSRKAGVGS